MSYVNRLIAYLFICFGCGVVIFIEGMHYKKEYRRFFRKYLELKNRQSRRQFIIINSHRQIVNWNQLTRNTKRYIRVLVKRNGNHAKR